MKMRMKVGDELSFSKTLLWKYFIYPNNCNIILSNHVHILFKAEPNTELSKFINAYKSASSRLIKKEYPIIREYLWKEHFWSRSFCLLTTGGAPIDIIHKYIESQGEKVK